MTLPPAAIQRGGEWVVPAIAMHRAGGWVTVSGTPAPAPEFVPDEGPVRNIASNMGVLQHAVTPGPDGEATATRHTLHANASEIVLGWFGRPNPAAGASEDTSLRAWARSAGGPWSPLTFNGAAEAVMAGWGDAVTLTPGAATDIFADPLRGPFYVGDVLEVMTWVSTPTGANGMGVQGRVDLAYDIGRVRGTPSEVTTASAEQFDASGPGTRPSVVLAPSAQASSWALIGDSNSVAPDRFYLSQAFRGRALPHILNGRGGLATMDLAGDWWGFQLGEQVKYADSVFSALGTNDGRAADPRGAMVAVWETARNAGVVRWVQGTVAPRAIDNGDGTTTGVYRPGDVLNPWLRDGAPIIDGTPVDPGAVGGIRGTVITLAGDVIPGDPAHPLGDGWVSDTGGALESEVGSGEYRQDEPRVYFPTDLTHYVQAGHDIQASLVERDLALMGF